VAKTKISLCVNLLPLDDDKISTITKYDSWYTNEAFEEVTKGIAPQYKCRAAEAAFCRSLLLVKRDPWDLIEHYFVPDEEFIYYDNKEDLKEKITYILDNYEQHEEMIERAYTRSLDYTSKPLVDIIRSKEEWKHLNV
jgi:spore maturation protein CgeB